MAKSVSKPATKKTTGAEQEENTGMTGQTADATMQGSNTEDDNDNENDNDTTQQDEQGPLQKFFIDSLKDIYWAEKALVAALPEMQQAATTEELQDAIEDHTLQTSKHVSRLEKVFRLLGVPAEAKECVVMKALIEEGKKVIAATPAKSMTRDAALIIAAQKVEHHEIACYGGLVQLALTLGYADVADILEKTLEEEEDTDSDLTDIAESYINFAAEEETAEDVEDLIME